jgi:hypothetical protein
MRKIRGNLRAERPGNDPGALCEDPLLGFQASLPLDTLERAGADVETLKARYRLRRPLLWHR